MTKKSVYLVRSYEEGCGPSITQVTEDLEEAKRTAGEVFAESCDPTQYPGDAAWVEEWTLSGSFEDARVVFRFDPNAERHDKATP